MTDELALIVIFFAICVVILAKCIWHGEYTEDFFLGPGTYIVGKDIPPGKGDLMAESGGGDFCIKEYKSTEWSITNKIGATSPIQPSRYRNLTLHRGDTLEINGNVNLMVTPPVKIKKVSKENLCPGNYCFGVDVPPGKYDFEAVGGDGAFYLFESGSKEYSLFQDMAEKNDQKAHSYANVVCERGSVLWIHDSLQLKLTPSAKPHIWL